MSNALTENRSTCVGDLNPVDGVLCPRCGAAFQVSLLDVDEADMLLSGDQIECVPCFCPQCGALLDTEGQPSASGEDIAIETALKWSRRAGRYRAMLQEQRTALLALADEIEAEAQEYVDRFDERSSTASMLNSYASRLREALGVADDE